MRLVDADELLKTLNAKGIPFNADINDVIINAPTVEPNRWISCNERLPNNTGLYLITIKLLDMSGKWRGDVTIGARNFNINKRSWFGVKQDDVIAWMPLPEPYKAESEDKE